MNTLMSPPPDFTVSLSLRRLSLILFIDFVIKFTAFFGNTERFNISKTGRRNGKSAVREKIKGKQSKNAKFTWSNYNLHYQSESKRHQGSQPGSVPLWPLLRLPSQGLSKGKSTYRGHHYSREISGPPSIFRVTRGTGLHFGLHWLLSTELQFLWIKQTIVCYFS